MTGRLPRFAIGIATAALLASGAWSVNRTTATAAVPTGTASTSTSETQNPSCDVGGLQWPGGCPVNTATLSVAPAPGLISYDEPFTITLPTQVKIVVPQYACRIVNGTADCTGNNLIAMNNPVDNTKKITWTPKTVTVYFELTSPTLPAAASPSPCPYNTGNYTKTQACVTMPVGAGVTSLMTHHIYAKPAIYQPLLTVQWEALMPFSLSVPQEWPIPYETLNCGNVADPAGVANYYPNLQPMLDDGSNYCNSSNYTNANQVPWQQQAAVNWTSSFTNTVMWDNYYNYTPQPTSSAYWGTTYNLGSRTIWWMCGNCGQTDRDVASDTRSCDTTQGGWTAGEGNEGESNYSGNDASNGGAAKGCFYSNNSAGRSDCGEPGGKDCYGSITYTDTYWDVKYQDPDLQVRNQYTRVDHYAEPQRPTQQYDDQMTWSYTQYYNSEASWYTGATVTQYDLYTASYPHQGVTAQSYQPVQANLETSGFLACPNSYDLSDPQDWNGGTLNPECQPNYDTRTWYQFSSANMPYQQQTLVQHDVVSHQQTPTWEDNQTLNWTYNIPYTHRWLVNGAWHIGGYYNQYWTSAADYDQCNPQDYRSDVDGGDFGEDSGPNSNFNNILVDYTTWGGNRNPCGPIYSWVWADSPYSYPAYDVASQNGTYNQAAVQDNWTQPTLDTQVNKTYFTCSPCNKPVPTYMELTKAPVTAAPLIENWTDGYQLTLQINQEQPVQAIH